MPTTVSSSRVRPYRTARSRSSAVPARAPSRAPGAGATLPATAARLCTVVGGLPAPRASPAVAPSARAAAGRQHLQRLQLDHALRVGLAPAEDGVPDLQVARRR